MTAICCDVLDDQATLKLGCKVQRGSRAILTSAASWRLLMGLSTQCINEGVSSAGRFSRMTSSTQAVLAEPDMST